MAREARAQLLPAKRIHQRRAFELRRPAHHRPDRLPADLRGPRHRALRPLQSLRNGDDLSPASELFYRADDRYNSGLFHFTPERGRPSQPDELTPTHDRRQAAQGIFGSLYFRNPLRIRCSPAGNSRTGLRAVPGQGDPADQGAPGEGRGEARGPQGRRRLLHAAYIVDYIVQNTVGELCEGKTPKAMSNSASSIRLRLRLVPAGRVQVLLECHRDWYVERRPGKGHQSQGHLSRTRRPVASDHRREETDSAQQHLRRGH